MPSAPGAFTHPAGWRYVYGAPRRPFVHPLRSPAGDVLSVDAPEDHPWQHGLWFTLKYVNGDNYWEEVEPFGVLRHTGDLQIGVDRVAGTVEWIHPDGETVVMRDRRSWRHVAVADDAYAIDLDVTLEAAADVVLDREPYNGLWGGYGGLSLRGAPDLVDSRALLAGRDGGRQRVEGDRSPWCDLSGTIEEKGRTAGILFCDRPGNPRHPVPWYVTTRSVTYGSGWTNFVSAAFLWDDPLALAAGEALRFAYRVVVHDGLWDQGRCTAEHKRWLSP